MDDTERIRAMGREYGPLYQWLYGGYERSTGGYAVKCADRGITPNDLTYFRAKLIPPFLLLHFIALLIPERFPAEYWELIPLPALALWPAVALFAVHLWLDMQDGRVYREMEKRKPGSGFTPNGAFLDHITDKATYIPAFFCLWFIGYAPLWVAVLVAVLDVTSAFSRKIRAWIMRRLGLAPDDGKSNQYGKIKTWAWAIAWIAFSFGPSSMCAQFVPYVSVAAGTFLAFKSLHLHLTRFENKTAPRVPPMA